MRSDKSLERLREEYAGLIQLEKRSKFIKIEPIEVSPGFPPDKYKVSYSCRGIEGVTEDGEPIISDKHEVVIYIDHNFPNSEPTLTWLTDIWHPNIEHLPPHTVCTDNIRSWYPTRDLAQLVIAMGEMIQYKRYHARWEHPYPIDETVATWVIEVAEKKGIIGAGKPFDKRALIRKILDPPFHQRKSSKVLLTERPQPVPERRVKLKF